MPGRLVKLPLGEAGARTEIMGFKQMGIEGERLIELEHRLRIALAQRQRQAARRMRLGETAIQIQRLGAGRQNAVGRDIGIIVQEEEGITVRNAGVGARIERVEFDRLGEHALRQNVVGFRVPVQELPASEVIGVGIEVLGWRPVNAPPLLGQQLDLQLVDDAARDLALDGKDVGELTVVAVGPEVTAVLAVDELGGDAHARAGLADAAFQDEFDPEILAHLVHLHRLALVGKRRIARDNEQAGDFRQVGDDVLGDPIAKIFLLGVAAHVCEWQHGDGRSVGRRRAGGFACGTLLWEIFRYVRLGDIDRAIAG